MSRKPVRRPARGGRRGPSRTSVRLVSALATAVALLVLGVVALAALVAGPGPADDKRTVILRPGAGVTEIGAELERAGVVRSAALFAAQAQLTGQARRLKAGEYEIAARAPQSAVLDQIAEGRVVRHFLTIPEGWTSEAAAAAIAASPLLTGAAPTPPEGALLPETYEIRRGEDRAAVMQRMLDARDALVRRLWAARRDGLPFTTPEQAVTLASIVEKETALPEERPRIAGVFVNRLRQGMRLESDPTVIYGLTGGRPLGRGLRVSELQRPTPFNTYLIDALPPTPIANPGKAALAAVLDPPATEELFFVADGSGGHVFARTYAEHLANVARWRQVEREQAGAARSTREGRSPASPRPEVGAAAGAGAGARP